MNTVRILFNCTRNYLGSRIRYLALCCLLHHLLLTRGRRLRSSRNRSFRLARAVVFDVAVVFAKSAQ